MGSFGRRARTIASWLATPLLPGDFLGVINPRWSTREPRATVVGVHRETADTTTLLLRPVAGLPAHRPGQFVGLGVQLDGVWTWRTYSITSRPGDDLLAVAVTAVPGGSVSRVLAHGTEVGAVLRIGPPAGEFVLPDPTPEKLLFVTAGSGITPVMGMLRTLAATRPAALDGAVLVHCDRDRDEVVFGPELRSLAGSTGLRLVERHTGEQGRLTPDSLTDLVPDWAARQAWACGPGGLLDDLVAHWDRAGDPDALHVERFRPLAVTAGAATGGRIRFTRSDRTVDAAPGTPVMVAGEAAGVLMPNGCRMGICHTCVVPLVSGAVRDLRTGEVHDSPDQPVRTCITAPTGDITLDL